MEGMNEGDMRNALLAELIDKMHDRLATKMFPPDPSKDDVPAVTAVSPEAKAAVSAEGSESDEMEPTDEELEEMLK